MAKQKPSALSGIWINTVLCSRRLMRTDTDYTFIAHLTQFYVASIDIILTFNASRYTLCVMIRSFKDSETEKIFHRTFSGKLPNDIQQIAFRKLRMLNRAQSLHDIRVPPANRLEKLSGKRKGLYSIRINDQWRVCFKWHHGDAFEVEITDYH